MNTLLKNLNVGAVCYVSYVAGNLVVKKHLANVGFFVGSKVVVLRISPYKSTYLLDVNGRVYNFNKSAISLIYVNKS